jgi:WD40 repeat protein
MLSLKFFSPVLDEINDNQVIYCMQKVNQNIATCSRKSVIIWDVVTKSVLNRIIFEKQVTDIAQLDSNRIAVSTYANDISVYDFSTSTQEKMLTGHSSSVFCLAKFGIWVN